MSNKVKVTKKAQASINRYRFRNSAPKSLTFSRKLLHGDYTTDLSTLDEPKPSLMHFFLLCFFVCFLASYIWKITGRTNYFSFTLLLNTLASAPTIDTSFIYTFANMGIVGDWGVFDFLRVFISDYCMPALSMVLFFVTGIAQLVVFLAYIFRSLFVGG